MPSNSNVLRQVADMQGRYQWIVLSFCDQNSAGRGRAFRVKMRRIPSSDANERADVHRYPAMSLLTISIVLCRGRIVRRTPARIVSFSSSTPCW